MQKRIAKNFNWHTVINVILFAIVCRGIYTVFFMNAVNRSLWIDEAFLASSFSKRSFFEILSEGEFDYLQSAPLGWLWLEKILSNLFGNTPYVLRMGSIIGFILTILLLVFIQIYFYKSKFPFAAAALMSNTPIILRYSNMFKPYIMDGFVTLAIAVAYSLWKKEKISGKWLAVIWMCLIWFSQTACFVIGGFGLCEFVFSCLRKDKKGVLKTLLLGAAVGVSFCLYYIVWVRRMTSIAGMQNFWDSYFFPFIPKSASDLSRGIGLLKTIFKQFDRASIFVLAFSVGGIIYFVWKKDRTFIGLYSGMVVALFASFLRLYPVVDRLWCFSYPIFALITFVAFERIVHRKIIYETIMAFVIVIVVMANTGFKQYSVKSNVYWNDEELQSEMDYLNAHMEPNDMVYVYSFSKPTFEYINGYGNTSFGKGENNVIFGEADFDWRFEFDYVHEIEKILSHSNLWIVSSHLINTQDLFSELLSALHENGYLELVDYQHETPLWYYSESLSDVKKHFTMDVRNLKSDGEWKEAVVHIKNDGEAYLNNPYDGIYLIETYSGTIYPVDDLIAPGNETDITVRFTGTEEREFILRSQYGKIAMDDSIIITKEMIGEE